MIAFGVYIGRDAEVLLTDRYMIVYRRDNARDFLESRLYAGKEDSFRCIGVCRTSPACTVQRKPPDLWQTAFVYSGRTEAADDEMKSIIGSSPSGLALNEGSLQIRLEDGSGYEAACEETFGMEDLSPALPEIAQDNVGECLRLWNMGLTEEFLQIGGVSAFIGITVNTAKHMYIFEMTPESVYCRAARYVTTNRGVVFNQNFRQGFEAYMIPDNREAAAPLPVDPALFAPDACAWDEKTVYWSVRSFDSGCITLNGCQGDTYEWRKPARQPKP